MPRKWAVSIVAGLVAGIVFLFFFLAMGWFWVWALLIAAAAYGGTLLVAPRPPADERAELPVGLSKELVDQVIGDARAAIRRIRAAARNLPDGAVREKALQVCVTADKVVDELQRDPKDIQSARQFLNYYLDATGRILVRYGELRAHGATGASVQKTLAQVEPTLEVIDSAFERELERVLRDDVLDLDTEISLLRKTVKMEGLLTEMPEPGDGPQDRDKAHP